MISADRSARAQLLIAVIAALGTALVVLPPALDAFSLPKAAWFVSGTALAVVVGAVRTSRRGVLAVPSGAFGWPLLAFVAGLGVATLASDAPLVSVVGRLGRYSGFAMYLAAVTAGVIIARRATPEDVRATVRGALGVCVLVALLAVAWWTGWDVLGLEARSHRSPASSVGNPNFTGAFAAFGLVIAGGLALDGQVRSRVWYAVAAVACLAGVLVSGALQAPFAAAAGGWAVALTFFFGRNGRWSGAAVKALLGGAGATAVAAGAGAAGVGPLALIGRQGTFQLRLDSWTAAWRMLLAEPFTGVGLDRYAAYFREYRPLEAAVSRPAEDFADAAHNVPLSMFANGGFLLGIAYLAVVGLVAWAGVRAVRVTDGDRRGLVGVVIGGWLAYQVQSVVSIDVPPLLAFHALFAGCLLALSPAPRFTSVDLPWRSATSRRRPPLVAWTPVALAAAVGIVVLTYVVGALRADTRSFDAQVAIDREQPDRAVALAEQAQEAAPWRAAYHVQEGRGHIQAGRYDEALSAMRAALARDPRSMDGLVTAARVAGRLEKRDLQVEMYRWMLQIEPHAPELLKEAAAALFEGGAAEEAVEVLLDVTASTPEDPLVWRDLGIVYRALDRPGDAAEAWERSLALQPSDEIERWLEELRSAG